MISKRERFQVSLSDPIFVAMRKRLIVGLLDNRQSTLDSFYRESINKFDSTALKLFAQAHKLTVVQLKAGSSSTFHERRKFYRRSKSLLERLNHVKRVIAKLPLMA